MALHTELPIYRDAYGLLRLSVIGKKNMRKDFKNSLGARIHDECIEVLSLLAEANAADDADKPEIYKLVLRHVGKIEFLLRVCNDEQLITTPVWAEAIALLRSVASQGGGLLKYFVRKRAPAV
jgi:hypothetical protein